MGKEPSRQCRRRGFDPPLCKDSLEGGHGNPLRYSCLEHPRGQRSLGWCGLQFMGSQRVGHDGSNCAYGHGDCFEMPLPPSSQHSDPQWKMGCHPRGQPRITPLLRCLPPPPCPSPPPVSATHTRLSSAIHPPGHADTGPFTVVSEHLACLPPTAPTHGRKRP